MLDKDTDKEHISPLGLESQGPRIINGTKGEYRYFTDVRMRHYIITLHQQAFPELAEHMRNNPNSASSIYSAFLAMFPLTVTGRLTPELKEQIMKTYKVI